MNNRIPLLVTVGFIILMVTALATCYFLITQLNKTMAESEEHLSLALNLRASTRNLISDYLSQGESVSTFLLDQNSSNFLQQKFHSDSSSEAHLQLAMISTQREDLRVLLHDLRSFDRTVTDSLENSIIVTAQTDINQAKRIYLTRYLAARGKNIQMALQAIRLATVELNMNLESTRSGAHWARTLAWLAMVGLAGIGIAIGALFTGLIRSMTRKLEHTAHSNKLLTENVLDIICSVDQTGVFISVNPACETILGCLPEELIGRPFRTIVRPEDGDLSDRFLGEIIAGADIVDFELVCLHRKGNTVTVLWSAHWSEYDQLMFCIGHDITEQKLLRKQLEDAMLRRSEELRQFATMIQNAQEQERRQLASNLHDDLGQNLSGMKMHIEECIEHAGKEQPENQVRLQGVKRQIDMLIGKIRLLSSNLRPVALDNFGLVPALKLLCKDFEKSHGLRVRCETNEIAIRRYDHRIEIALYRIAQEALTNVAQHAGVNEASLSCCCIDNTVVLRIEDAGVGFRTGAATDREGIKHGFGLLSMKERAELLGGAVSIVSAPHEGTTVSVIFPAVLYLHEKN